MSTKHTEKPVIMAASDEDTYRWINGVAKEMAESQGTPAKCLLCGHEFVAEFNDDHWAKAFAASRENRGIICRGCFERYWWKGEGSLETRVGKALSTGGSK